MHKPSCVLIIAVMLMAVAGCQPAPAGEATLSTPGASTATITPAAPVAGISTTIPAPPTGDEDLTSEPEQLTLTVWTVEAVSPLSDTPGGQVLLEQLTLFDETYPDIHVVIYNKMATGPGSTLAYLRAARDVAPGVLPDLALLDREALVQAAREGLIVPVGTLVDPAVPAGVYPVALSLGMVGSDLVGVPYVLQVSHAVYRETLFQEPPGSFEAVLASPVPYVFPAGTTGYVNRTILTQYMAAGGALVDENGAPYLDPDVLTDVLNFYAVAHDAGVVDTALFQITDLADSWARYLNRQAGLAEVLSTVYLAERDRVRSTGVIWTPTPDGEPYALASGWLWVVTTRDPDRQAAAMLLVNFLMNPINQGVYTQAAGWLPSQSSALAVWGDADPYTGFGDELLSHAALLPDSSVRAVAGAAIQDALEAVLLDGIPPFQAASAAAQRVTPSGQNVP